MSLLDIHVLGSPVLREETVVVPEVTAEIRQLVGDMFETMYAANGIGLAAPQVGRRERVAVLDVGDNPMAIINPEIVVKEGAARGEEGCLSIPEVYGDIERATRVVVRALNVRGEPVEIDATELLARCLQHEIDHLHGRLFIDYLSVLKRRSAIGKWEREKAKYPAGVRKLDPREVAEHHGNKEEAL